MLQLQTFYGEKKVPSLFVLYCAYNHMCSWLHNMPSFHAPPIVFPNIKQSLQVGSTDQIRGEVHIKLKWHIWGRFKPTSVFNRLPRGHSGKEFTCQCRRHEQRGFNSWVGKIPWSRKWQPVPVFLPGEIHGQRSLLSYSLWYHRVRHDWACTSTDVFNGHWTIRIFKTKISI